MSDNSPVPLIVFAPQREPSEFINSLMRKAGEPVHCTWIPAVRDLGEALEQLNPELLICAYVPDADIRQAATIRDQLIDTPGRIAHSAHQQVVHPPQDWPWEPGLDELFRRALHDPLPSAA